MAWEPIIWLIFSVINFGLLASNLYQLLGFSDLEADHMNPYELSSRINAVILPDYLLHAAFCILFLVTGHWIMFLLTLPAAYYNLRQYMSRQHLIDVTEVFRVLNTEKKARFIKLCFYGVFFALMIIRLIFSAIYEIFNEDEMVHSFGIP